MLNEKGVMKFESTLPADFNGTFQFTNWSEDDFEGMWGGKKYIFTALTTSPMLIPEHSPLEIQQIRKKFAKDLAVREFYKTKSYKNLRGIERNADGTPRLNSSLQANSYNENDLESLIKRALEPLPASRARVQKIETPPLEDKLTRNEEGELNTQAIDSKLSLRDKALRGK